MHNKTRLIPSLIACILCACILLLSAGCGAIGGQRSALNPDEPVTVTIWNYYNGDQLAAFDQLLETFNNTVGAEKGIVAVGISQNDINALADSLLASVNGEANAQETPVLAAVYAETAYILNQKGALIAMDKYFTEEELSAYVPGFLDEGRFNAGNELMLFPILKSTELFTANETDWAPFAEATGITLSGIATKEDLTAAAKAYYEWTDAQTPNVPDDGKALYGRDSVSNYVYIGCKQLGHELFTVTDGELSVDLDRDTFKTLWDNFYIPFVNGYFGAYAKFRSEDCKTGKILALTSSSSSTSYLPVAVTNDDDSTHDISTYGSRDLPFADAATDAVVQQGASYCLIQSTEAQQEGAVMFLKWFTEPQRNLDFAQMSGYSASTLAANNAESIRASYSGDVTTSKGQNVLNSLLISADVFINSQPYTTKPFSGSKEARVILGDALENRAIADRAEVVAQMESGITREEALRPFITDEYFDSWFADLCAQVNACVGK